MKKVLIIGIVFLGLAVVAAALYQLHPLAPVMLGISLLVQAPLIVLIGQAALKGSYAQRAASRRAAFAASKDAKAWLEEETRESQSPGYRYWSPTGKALAALNRAEAAYAAGQTDLSLPLLAGVAVHKLPPQEQARYHKMLENLTNGKPYQPTWGHTE